VHKAGACAIGAHSDSDIGIQRLNQESRQGLADGKKKKENRHQHSGGRGVAMVVAESRPKSLGIDGKTGSLRAAAQMADLVRLSGNPFSASNNQGRPGLRGWCPDVNDRSDAANRPVMDFELGQPVKET